MKKNAKIQLGDLPKRETTLSVMDIKNVFGGCSGVGDSCSALSNCCPGFACLYENGSNGICFQRSIY